MANNIDTVLPTTSNKRQSILKNGANISSTSISAEKKKRVHFGVSFQNNFYGFLSMIKVREQKKI